MVAAQDRRLLIVAGEPSGDAHAAQQAILEPCPRLALRAEGDEVVGERGELFEFLATVRDWFPAILILVAYRESGLLLLPDASHRLDYLFVRWDHALLRSRWVLGVLDYGSPWVQRATSPRRSRRNPSP